MPKDVLLAHASRSARAADGDPTRVEALSFTDIEQTWPALVEKGAERRIAIGMRYFSARGGKTDWRCGAARARGPAVEVRRRVSPVGHVEVVRIENVSHGKLDPDTRYRRHDESEVGSA